MPVRTRPPLSLLPESPMRTGTDFSSEPPQLVFRVYRGPVTLAATINLFRRELHLVLRYRPITEVNMNNMNKRMNLGRTTMFLLLGLALTASVALAQNEARKAL